MAKIRLLEQATIDKIAAGEVVERPRSVVKELTENAIDAGATAVTVEIRDGGITMIRVTDDGAGIGADEIRTAFLRHSTSKIETVDDLNTIQSYGFRGEALSSIAAVSRMEVITKTRDSLTGIRYRIEGGHETGMEEIGAPDGSTFLMRDLFYNTPARRKFLKSAQTEAGYVSEFCDRLALSHPELSIRFIANGVTKLATSGGGSRKDVIYRVFGREIAGSLIELDKTDESTGARLHGYLGKPQISRGNRTYEIFFVNGRLITSGILSKASEEGYETFLMQHRFPFLILSLDLDGSTVDVNVHPAKAQVRFSDGPGIYRFVRDSVKAALTHRELIVRSDFGNGEDPESSARERAKAALQEEFSAEPFETRRRSRQTAGPVPSEDHPEEELLPDENRKEEKPLPDEGRKERESLPRKTDESPYDFRKLRDEHLAEESSPYSIKYPLADSEREAAARRIEKEEYSESRNLSSSGTRAGQMTLQDYGREVSGKTGAKEDNADFLTREHVKEHRLVGQVFGTYWIVEFRSSVYVIDQHAAHEKVLFERLMKRFREKTVTSQQLSPPIIVSLSMAEEDQLKAHREDFEKIGFEISPFGDRDYAISAVPQDVFGLTEKEFFLELLDGLSSDTSRSSVEDVTARVATMACKAAVKGNTRLTFREAETLIDELLTLDDPYNCPHGRPTILSVTRTQLEKKFKRIV